MRKQNKNYSSKERLEIHENSSIGVINQNY